MHVFPLGTVGQFWRRPLQKLSKRTTRAYRLHMTSESKHSTTAIDQSWTMHVLFVDDLDLWMWLSWVGALSPRIPIRSRAALPSMGTSLVSDSRWTKALLPPISWTPYLSTYISDVARPLKLRWSHPPAFLMCSLSSFISTHHISPCSIRSVGCSYFSLITIISRLHPWQGHSVWREDDGAQIRDDDVVSHYILCRVWPINPPHLTTNVMKSHAEKRDAQGFTNHKSPPNYSIF
jgi:hypothetical protein